MSERPRKPFARLLSLPVHAYRLTLSPFLGHGCRYQPTCSAYALDALERHGALRGGYMAMRRLGRCHPWGQSGWDPVPDRWPGWHAAGRKRPETADTDTDPPAARQDTPTP